MKILLTGGTGYVGSTLRAILAEKGHRVRLLVRRGSESKITSLDSYETVSGDVLDTNSCLRACEGVDAVVHLVGIIREFPEQGITFDELHVSAMENIVNAAKLQGVKRLVHMSALGAREDAPSLYHRTKYSAEEIVRSSSIPFTIFRPSIIYAPGDEFMRLIVGLVNRGLVPLIGGGKAKLQPVSRSEVCCAIASSITKPEARGSVFELGGADRVTFKELVDRTAAHLDRRIRTISVRSWMVKPVVRLMERYPWFPLTGDQLTMLLEDNVCDTLRAEELLGFRPSPFLRDLPMLLDGSQAGGQA